MRFKLDPNVDPSGTTELNWSHYITIDMGRVKDLHGIYIRGRMEGVDNDKVKGAHSVRIVNLARQKQKART